MFSECFQSSHTIPPIASLLENNTYSYAPYITLKENTILHKLNCVHGQGRSGLGVKEQVYLSYTDSK